MRNHSGSIIKDFSTSRKCDIQISKKKNQTAGRLGMVLLAKTLVGFHRQPDLRQRGSCAAP
jgi:hypothetical protein